MEKNEGNLHCKNEVILLPHKLLQQKYLIEAIFIKLPQQFLGRGK